MDAGIIAAFSLKCNPIGLNRSINAIIPVILKIAKDTALKGERMLSNIIFYGGSVFISILALVGVYAFFNVIKNSLGLPKNVIRVHSKLYVDTTQRYLDINLGLPEILVVYTQQESIVVNPVYLCGTTQAEIGEVDRLGNVLVLCCSEFAKCTKDPTKVVMWSVGRAQIFDMPLDS